MKPLIRHCLFNSYRLSHTLNILKRSCGQLPMLNNLLTHSSLILTLVSYYTYNLFLYLISLFNFTFPCLIIEKCGRHGKIKLKQFKLYQNVPFYKYDTENINM